MGEDDITASITLCTERHETRRKDNNINNKALKHQRQVHSTLMDNFFPPVLLRPPSLYQNCLWRRSGLRGGAVYLSLTAIFRRLRDPPWAKEKDGLHSVFVSKVNNGGVRARM